MIPEHNVLKAYIRCREERCPVTRCTYDAMEGLHNLGVEVVPFYGFGDLADDFSRENMVVGYIGDVMNALTKVGVPQPERMDYPKSLEQFYGRKIERGVLGDIRYHHNGSKKVFIKPSMEEKLFTGIVWEGTEGDRRHVCTHGDDVEIWISETVNFISEFRCYVLDGEILDVRRYKGIWGVNPDRNTIESMLKSFTNAPIAHSIDVGVLPDGSTKLVEINDAYALGNYGLNSYLYAKMLMARWEQLVTEPRKEIEQIA